jgi:hypothetical protein
MSDKPCQCKFCIDYKRFKQVLPLIPLEHREWFESIFDNLWNAQEELSYKKAILDGSWPDAVVILEHHLANAKAKADANIYATPEQVATAESDLNFDCKVCEVCNNAMTSKQYWAHPCQQVVPPTYEHSCDVVDISDGPCGDPSHDEDAVAEKEDCPECKGLLIERTNSKTGHTFLGCSTFPECHYSKAGGSNPAPARVVAYDDYEDEDMDDDDFFGGFGHQGDFF